jgi:hypothetical protein
LIDPQSLNGKWAGTVACTTGYFSRGLSNARAGIGAAQAGLGFDHDSRTHVDVWGPRIGFSLPDSSVNLEFDDSQAIA